MAAEDCENFLNPRIAAKSAKSAKSAKFNHKIYISFLNTLISQFFKTTNS